MSERGNVIADFLAQSQWADWDRTALAGDASTRRYERLVKQNQSVILMDSPPDNAENTAAFTDIAAYLTKCGLCPPAILAQDHSSGVLVLSDLGNNDYARWLRTSPQDSKTLYKAAIDVLIKLQSRKPPENLNQMTPNVGAEMVKVTGEYYARADVSELQATLQTALQTYAPHANTFAMRDYHAENLIWRPGLSGTARIGLLDFQDAFIAPDGYDLASLLRDARRDLEPGFVDEMVVYFLEKTHHDDTFRAQLACLGAQRNLRILGVFARLSIAANKIKYVDLIPRVWNNLQMDLAHPALKQLQQAVGDCLPAPDTTFLEGLRQ